MERKYERRKKNRKDDLAYRSKPRKRFHKTQNSLPWAISLMQYLKKQALFPQLKLLRSLTNAPINSFKVDSVLRCCFLPAVLGVTFW